ncbi:MAG: hypothetical protein WBE26_02800, partial [Phycisphaerae bacterium]
MQSRVLRLSFVVAAIVCLMSSSAMAQEFREPEGGALPPYARVLRPYDERGPAAPVTTARNSLPNIMVTGYWPPTNEMLRPFSTNPTQNPDGWVGENWEGRFYNVYSFFPEFPEGLGKGEGDFEVDYQDTSADWWRIVAEVNPVAIITFGRADPDFDWELEGGHRMLQLGDWSDDYLAPSQPTPELPIADETPGTQRWSSLPLQAIVDAVGAAVPNLDSYHTYIDDSDFLCNFIGYHATWYHDQHSDPEDPVWNVAAGHVHVGSTMELEDAILATEVTLRTLVEYLNTQLPMRGDFDGDRDVDQSDETEFLSCFTGPGGPFDPGCEPGDFDGDDDIDCDDWEAFKLGWTGPPTYPTFFVDCDLDCNGNSTADEFDIAEGTSEDCNGNGIPDECESGCVTAFDGDVDDGETVTLNPGGGGGDPTVDALVEFTNQSGSGGASIIVNETTDPVHPGAGGFDALGTALIIQTSLADGQFFMTVTIPFDDVGLGGADPLSIDLTWFDEVKGEWVLAVAGNTLPSPGNEPYMVGDRFADSGTVTPELNDLSDDLGDYGVFWKTDTLQGFVWANVDHATDFAAGIRLCSTADAPQPEPVAIDKNRYLSLVPGNPGEPTALRVTLVDLPSPFEGFSGQVRWVGAPSDISESSANSGPTPPPTFKGAILQCEPYYMDWSKVGLVHVYGDAIVPNAVYEVQAVAEACDAGVEDHYSDALTTVTPVVWGDVVGEYYTNPANCMVMPSGYVDCWSPPNGVVNFDDISSLVDKFRNLA